MILPGPIGPHTAQELTRFLELTERNTQLLDAWQDGRLDRFPARVNDYQSSTGRYSWTEQTFTAFGQRYDRPGGRTGSFTYSPAYGYGGGVVTEFPMPVWLTRRVIGVESGSGGLSSIGPVYEFPTYCACISGIQSGSGDLSGSFVLVPCCPNPLPRTLYLTLSAPAIPCLDGLVIPLGFLAPGLDIWRGSSLLSGCTGATEVFFTLRCGTSITHPWTLELSQTVGIGCFFDVTSPGSPNAGFSMSPASLVSCDPFAATFGPVYFLNGGICLATGVPDQVTFTISE